MPKVCDRRDVGRHLARGVGDSQQERIAASCRELNGWRRSIGAQNRGGEASWHDGPLISQRLAIKTGGSAAIQLKLLLRDGGVLGIRHSGGHCRRRDGSAARRVAQ